MPYRNKAHAVGEIGKKRRPDPCGSLKGCGSPGNTRQAGPFPIMGLRFGRHLHDGAMLLMSGIVRRLPLPDYARLPLPGHARMRAPCPGRRSAHPEQGGMDACHAARYPNPDLKKPEKPFPVSRHYRLSSARARSKSP